MTDSPKTLFEHEVMLRICGEYLEMPGLRLTTMQAQRLFGLCEHTCTRVLEGLVARGFLVRQRNGMYRRSTDGCADLPAILHAEAKDFATATV